MCVPRIDTSSPAPPRRPGNFHAASIRSYGKIQLIATLIAEVLLFEPNTNRISAGMVLFFVVLYCLLELLYIYWLTKLADQIDSK